MKPTVTWVLIADGAHARVLENTGPGKGLTTVDGLDFSQPKALAQELHGDREGEAGQASDTGDRHETRVDEVELRETALVKAVAQVLEKKHQAKAFDRLVIAAAPIALGDIRKQLSPQIKKTVVAELNKDLTNIPTDQLPRHFDGIFAA